MRNYSDPQYKDWRKKIYARDKHSCQWPGCNKRKSLQAHHILKWSEFPGLRFHIDNGITLCRTHHESIKNNEEAYINFFNQLILKGKQK
jgi:predicted restriction endonuclease